MSGRVVLGVFVAAPARAAVVTLVAADRSLPVVSTRVTGSEPDDHDGDVAVHLEPVKARAWLDWAPPDMNHAWHYPRVMILAGDVPSAKALDPKAVVRGDLPKGTRAGDILVAVDRDGDQHADVVARHACENGKAGCELGCDEVWLKAAGKWARVDKTCGD